MSLDIQTHEGSCLCGGVRFEITGPLDELTFCHCSQCRKSTGHFFATTGCKDTDMEFIEDRGLEWYRASDHAKRGFCKTCGSSLFWKPDDDDYTSILAGCLETPTNLSRGKHIFVADKGDYYELTDGLPQFPQDE